MVIIAKKMYDMKYPKLLVITDVDYINEVGATANTLRSFLSSWPSDNVRLLVCKDFNADSSVDFNNIYTLSHRDIWVASRFIKGHRTAKSSVGSHMDNSRGQNNKISLFKSFKSYVRTQLINLYQLLPYKFGKKLNSWLDDFHPDIIYLCVTNYRSFLICNKIAKKYRIPIIPHFLDDWLNVQLYRNKFGSLYSKRFHELFTKVMSNVPFGLCISDLMSETYKYRYGKNFYSLMNSVPSYAANSNKQSLHISKFLYAGSLYLKREQSLLLICEALSSSLFQNIEFDIYAPQDHWEELKYKFAKYTFVHYGGFLDSEQLKHQISLSDVVVFAESFDSSVLEFSRLSLSTRIPEFLSSGKPILAVGPSEQGAIQYLEKNNAAFVISEKSKAIDVINNLKNSELVQQKLSSAKHLFLQNHVTSVQQQKFYNWVNCAITNYLN